MEASLFRQENNNNNPAANEAVLQALLADNVYQHLINDASRAKIDSLKRLRPMTRGLQKFTTAIEQTNDDNIVINNIDYAIDILEIYQNLAANNFTI
uniref:PlxyGVORF64 protein n=1 Tax=Plutella xylostella granulovirus TaxID=98383 RepID=A0A1B2CSG0_9BBAC|nr:PlxyGVORF64 protein [Plutella xylostella granulovirus]